MFRALCVAAAIACAGVGCAPEVQSGSSGGGSGEPSVCDDFLNEPGSSRVTVRLVNLTDTDVYLGNPNPGCGEYQAFDLRDAAGRDLVWMRDMCDFTCEDVMRSACGCPAFCPVAPVTLVAPQGAYEVVWSGTIFEPSSIPDVCLADPTCGTSSCLVERAPAAGELFLTATAWTGVEGRGCPQEPCGCTPDATGTCVVEGDVNVTGQPIRVVGKIDRVETSTVQIFFH
jgi:hypothetical protein